MPYLDVDLQQVFAVDELPKYGCAFDLDVVAKIIELGGRLFFGIVGVERSSLDFHGREHPYESEMTHFLIEMPKKLPTEALLKLVFYAARLGGSGEDMQYEPSFSERDKVYQIIGQLEVL